MPASAKTRIAIIVREGPVPRWMADVVRRLKAHPELEVLGAASPGRAAATGGRAQRLYRRLDQRVFGGLAGNISAPVNLDLARVDLAVAKPDIVLALEPPPRGVETQTTSGVWQWFVGGNPRLENWQAIVNGSPTVELELRVTLPDGRVIARPEGAIAADTISLARGEAVVASKLSALFLPALLSWRQNRFAEFQKITETSSAQEAPQASAVLRGGLGVVRRFVEARTVTEEWFIGIRPAGTGTPWQDERPFASFYPAADRFYADPFVFRHQGRSHLFFEDFQWGTRKGVIATALLDERGVPGSVETVLEEPHHLAFPAVFEADGEIWMTPDSGEAGVVLYRATDFPRRWERIATLLPGVRAVDPALVQHDGRWWMFVSIAQHPAALFDELFVFHAERLTGPWMPHALNPVLTDIVGARPAGHLFRRNGRLIRPGQDGSRTYGYALTFSEVTRLTPDEYEERPLGRFDPVWHPGLVATHTFNCDGVFEVVDGRRRVARLPPSLAVRARKLGVVRP